LLAGSLANCWLESLSDSRLAAVADMPANQLRGWPLAGSCLATRLASGPARRPAGCSLASPNVAWRPGWAAARLPGRLAGRPIDRPAAGWLPGWAGIRNPGICFPGSGLAGLWLAVAWLPAWQADRPNGQLTAHWLAQKLPGGPAGLLGGYLAGWQAAPLTGPLLAGCLGGLALATRGFCFFRACLFF
jgi:hypothetical protein